MDNHDWTTFRKRISIKANTDTIFNAWTTQENIEKWFLSQAEFSNKNGVKKDRHAIIEKGDTYLWEWHGSDNKAQGEILESNNKDFLKFTFLGCIVSLKVSNENGEHVIELTQSDIPLDETSRVNYYVGCSRGWTFYLTNLKSILEGGIDLRNRNKELTDVINT